MPNKEEIFAKVKESLVEALSVDEDEVTAESSLTRDLGAESIDFLDIIFRLEKGFGIKIPRGDLFPENLQNNPEYVQGGKLTPAGLTALKEKLPYADITKFSANPAVSNLGDIFTVGMIVGYIETRKSKKT
jgi:acyl carrier protein